MAAHTHVAVGYNVQIAVDAKHKLIVEQQVTNQVVDFEIHVGDARRRIGVDIGGGIARALDAGKTSQHCGNSAVVAFAP
jgi:hypothetical protein